MSLELKAKARPLFDPPIVRRAVVDALRKLGPRHQMRNPVVFIVEIGSMLTTILLIQALLGNGEAPAGFILAIAVWLWFTVIFANFAEAMAEGRGKAQADALRKFAARYKRQETHRTKARCRYTVVSAGALCKDDVVLIEAGDFVPGDGEVIEGVASVDESAITGESAPVIRESGGDRSAVTGGTRVLSDGWSCALRPTPAKRSWIV